MIEGAFAFVADKLKYDTRALSDSFDARLEKAKGTYALTFSERETEMNRRTSEAEAKSGKSIEDLRLAEACVAEQVRLRDERAEEAAVARGAAEAYKSAAERAHFCFRHDLHGIWQLVPVD